MTDWGAERSYLHKRWFLMKFLVQERGNMEKRVTKFSCSHLAVDISRFRASCCSEQPPVSMGGLVPRYRARKKGGCLGRKQESIFESGAWTYISCSWQNTNFVFGLVLYRRERRAATWPGESKFFVFFLVLQWRNLVAEPHPWCSWQAGED